MSTERSQNNASNGNNVSGVSSSGNNEGFSAVLGESADVETIDDVEIAVDPNGEQTLECVKTEFASAVVAIEADVSTEEAQKVARRVANELEYAARGPGGGR